MIDQLAFNKKDATPGTILEWTQGRDAAHILWQGASTPTWTKIDSFVTAADLVRDALQTRRLSEATILRTAHERNLPLSTQLYYARRVQMIDALVKSLNP